MSQTDDMPESKISNSAENDSFVVSFYILVVKEGT